MHQRHPRDQQYEQQNNRNQPEFRRNEERSQDYGRYGWEQQNREQDFSGNYATSGDEWRGTADRMPEYNQPRGGQDRYSQGGTSQYSGQGQSGIGQRLFGNDMGGGQFDPSHQNWGERSNYGNFSSGQRSMSGQQPQQHRGRGPKGYQRTDQRIEEDVCERLCDDPNVDASDVTVTVKDSVVTLEGSVDSRTCKHRIEDIADSCSGVKDVQNRLSVSTDRWSSGSIASNASAREPHQGEESSPDTMTEH